MQVTVEMPDQVARQWGETPDTVGRHVMEDAAIEGYRAGRLTQRQVGAMLGLDYWQTEAFLNERAVHKHDPAQVRRRGGRKDRTVESVFHEVGKVA